MSFIDEIHPGCLIALSRLTMDEIGVARSIAAGELISPQQYGTFWMFAIRITGTGTAYRPMLSEIVYRSPDNYLNENFLARCNGLPVILDHPEPDKKNPSGMLNTAEYKDRVIGAIMLPYIKGNEVWGIARINDVRAAHLMMQEDLSTSPGVSIRPMDGDSMELKLAGGGTIYFEGKPYLIDHIAICSAGVWDKEGEAGLGVLVQSRSDSIMAESKEEKEARETKERDDKARKDRRDKMRMDNPRKDGESEDDHEKRLDAMEKSSGEAPDQLLSTLDAFRKSITDAMEKHSSDFSKRMDEIEKWKNDSARRDESEDEKKKREETESKERDDKTRRDEVEKEKEKEKERADAAERERADAVAEVGTLKQRLAALESRTPLSADNADYPVMVGFQARADRTYGLHGLNAPRPMEGETPVAYRRRLVVALQKHSIDYKDVDLSTINDDKMLAIVEKRVFADAEEAAKRPVDLGVGELRKVERRDDVGRKVTEFHGDPIAWMQQFAMPYRMVSAINRHPE